MKSLWTTLSCLLISLNALATPPNCATSSEDKTEAIALFLENSGFQQPDLYSVISSESEAIRIRFSVEGGTYPNGTTFKEAGTCIGSVIVTDSCEVQSTTTETFSAADGHIIDVQIECYENETGH